MFQKLCGVAVLGWLGFLSSASASLVSPVQSSADPLGLKIVAPVQIGGSDAASANFMQDLAGINATIKSKLPESTAESPATTASMALNPAALRLATTSMARVYFVSEGASYHSSLGFNTFSAGSAIPTATTPGVTSNAQWILPDASSSAPNSLSSAGNSVRTSSEPLLAGDFVDLGTFGAGTLLDFFLVPYGAQGGTADLTDETARNPDNFQHIVSFWSADNRYLVLSFEDMVGGGDKDYNDVVVAVDFSSALMQQATTAPEPGAWAGLAAMGLLTVWNSRRKSGVAQAA